MNKHKYTPKALLMKRVEHDYEDFKASMVRLDGESLFELAPSIAVEATSLREAKPKLERIEADIIGNFKVLGVKAMPLNGVERLAILHGQMHPDGKDIFQFDWNDLPKTGLSTKDYIAPTSFDFRGGKTFRMGTTIGAVSFIQIIAPELSDRLLADYLEMNNAVTVNLHIKSIDQSEAIKIIKRKITDLDAMKIAEQKKAVRAGYDMDVIPTDIATYGDEAKNILKTNYKKSRGKIR